MIGLFIIATLASISSAAPSAEQTAAGTTAPKTFVIAPEFGYCGNNEKADLKTYGCMDANPCCSKQGYCGHTSEYCNSSCQDAFSQSCTIPPPPPPTTEPLTVHPEGKCGHQPGGLSFKCKEGYCCSKSGFCGQGSAWCGDGCQTPYSKCELNTSVPTTDPFVGRCGVHPDMKDSRSCSLAAGCCSIYGYCGTSSDFCAEGCQSKFSFAGACMKSMYPDPVPTGDKQKVFKAWTGKDNIAQCGAVKGGEEYGCSGPDGCCSPDGYCGHQNKHCAVGCQIKYSSKCYPDGPLSPGTPPQPPPGSTYGDNAPKDCFNNTLPHDQPPKGY